MSIYKLYYADNSELSQEILKKIMNLNLRDQFHLVRLDSYLKTKQKMPKIITTIPSVLFEENGQKLEVRNDDILKLIDDLSQETMKNTLKKVRETNKKNNWLEQALNTEPGKIDPKSFTETVSAGHKKETELQETEEEFKKRRAKMDEKLKSMYQGSPMNTEQLNKLFSNK